VLSRHPPAVRGKRRRLRAVDSRELILAAAERLLEAGGVDAVKVRAVADAVGVTDAAVHHHFTNRQGLLEALLRRAGKRLKAQLHAVTADARPDGTDLEQISRLFSRWYDRRGYARLAMWLMLAGWSDAGHGMLGDLVTAVHRTRLRRAAEERRARPALAETRAIVAWFHSAMMSEPLFGGASRRSAGLSDDDASRRRSRRMVLHTFEALVAHGVPNGVRGSVNGTDPETKNGVNQLRRSLGRF